MTRSTLILEVLEKSEVILPECPAAGGCSHDVGSIPLYLVHPFPTVTGSFLMDFISQKQLP